MYILNNQVIDENIPQLVNDVQYPAGWFLDENNRNDLNLQLVISNKPVFDSLTQKLTAGNLEQVNGIWTQEWSVENLPDDEAVSNITSAKQIKNTEINNWRLEANQAGFPFMGKQIGSDPLSRSDIDGVAGSISLTGGFPNNFPMAWKCLDNNFISLPDVAAFKNMYSAMTDQGTATFTRSQQLKSALASATTKAEIDAIEWN